MARNVRHVKHNDIHSQSNYEYKLTHKSLLEKENKSKTNLLLIYIFYLYIICYYYYYIFYLLLIPKSIFPCNVISIEITCRIQWLYLQIVHHAWISEFTICWVLRVIWSESSLFRYANMRAELMSIPGWYCLHKPNCLSCLLDYLHPRITYAWSYAIISKLWLSMFGE